MSAYPPDVAIPAAIVSVAMVALVAFVHFVRGRWRP